MNILHKTGFALFIALAGVIAASFVFIASPPESAPVFASESHNLSGHAWNDKVGWVSFNCTNHQNICANDPARSCTVDANCSAVGGSCLLECENSNYGVNIAANGIVSGYAWNDKVGWISFQESAATPDEGFRTQCPSSCLAANNCSACYKTNSNTGTLYGWAKILNMGDNGWIHLQKLNSSLGFTYGAKVNNTSNGAFSGWTYNGNGDGSGLGWLSFSSRDCDTDGNGTIDVAACGTVGSAITSYAVQMDNPPTATNLKWEYPQGVSNPSDVNDHGNAQLSYCASSPPAYAATTNYYPTTMVLRWTFVDEQPTSAKWRVQVWKQQGNQLVIDTGEQPGSATQCVLGVSPCAPLAGRSIELGTAYKWEVTVWDTADFNSGPVAGPNFTTLSRDYPDVDFSMNPAEPRALENVTFTANATVYSGSPSYLWTFTSASETTTTTPNPTVKFYDVDSASARLDVTDGGGYLCGKKDDSIGVTQSFPIWRETRPQ